MFKKSEGPLSYTVGSIDEVIEEKGSQFTAFREISFGEDTDKKYLECRRYMYNNEGKEQMLKGVTFLTPEGPQELAKAVIRNNFGTTEEYLETLKDSRSDFDVALNKVLGPEDKRFDPSLDMGEVYDAADFIPDDDEI